MACGADLGEDGRDVSGHLDVGPLAPLTVEEARSALPAGVVDLGDQVTCRESATYGRPSVSASRVEGSVRASLRLSARPESRMKLRRSAPKPTLR